MECLLERARKVLQSRVSRQPGGCRTVVEPSADGNHQVGTPASLIGGISTVVAYEAESQLVLHVD